MLVQAIWVGLEKWVVVLDCKLNIPSPYGEGGIKSEQNATKSKRAEEKSKVRYLNLSKGKEE